MSRTANIETIPAVVRVGWRYRQASGGYGVWRVIGVTTDYAGNQHGQLMLESDHTRRVTIAFSALHDPSLYEAVDQSDVKVGRSHGTIGVPNRSA